MKKKLLLAGLLVILATGLLSGFAQAGSDLNYDPTVSGSEVTVALSTTYETTCRWENVFAGSEGWSDQWYVLNWPGGGLEIHCYDGYWAGDFYSVWIVETAPIAYSVRSDVDGHLYSIDLMTGVATDLGLVGLTDAQGLAFVGSTLYGIGGTVEEFWDLTTPPGSKIGDTGPRSGIDAGLGYDPTTYKMHNIQRDGTGAYLYEVDLATGAATFIGSHSGDVPDSLAIDNTGVAYAIDGLAGSLYTVDLLTGSLTLVGNFPAVQAESGLSFDSGGTLWGIFDNGEIYTFDTVTGASTFVSQVTLAGSPIGGFEALAVPCARASRLFTTPQVTQTPWVYPPDPWPAPEHSDMTFYWWFVPGTYEFRVRDEKFHKLVAEGKDPCDPAEPWCPAGVFIGFHSAPHVIPEVPLGTAMAGAAMIVTLIAYIGIKPARVFRRRP